MMLEDSKIGKFRRVGVTFLKGFLGLLVLLTVTYLALAVYAGKKRNESLAAWREAGYDIEKRYEELSDNEENQCAAEIKAIAGKLGLVSVGGGNPVKVDYRKVHDYTTQQLQKDGLQFVQPDAEVVEKLQKIEPELGRLREILDRGLPTWGFMRRDMGCDTVGHFAVIGLVKLLCAESLYAASRGRSEEAARDLHSCVKLQESLRPKGTLFGALIFIASHDMILGTARFLPQVDEDLRRYISDIDPAEVMADGFAAETALLNNLYDLYARETAEEKRMGVVYNFLTRPYWRLCQFGSCEINAFYLREVEKEDPCSLGDSGIMKKVEQKIPWWNIFAAISTPNLQDMWVRAYRTKLDRDMTLIILRARSEKAKAGSWPDSIGLPKSICPDTSWKYEKKGEACSISFCGEFKNPDAKGVILPLKWEE